MMSDLLEKMKAVWDYDPNTGVFIWKIKTYGQGGMIYPGYPAGAYSRGYCVLYIDKRSYQAHRVAWLFMTGGFPPKGFGIDHVNRVRSDNRWCNLRLATQTQNNMNMTERVDNTSGARGVYYAKPECNWFARIQVNKKIICLGRFATKEKAIAARKKAELEYFGEYAPQ